MNFLQSLFGARPAVSNRSIAKVSRGGQAIATVHGSNRTAGSTATGAAVLGVGTRFGGAHGNAGRGGGRGR